MAYYKTGGGGGIVLDWATMKADYVLTVSKNGNATINLPVGEYLQFLTTESAFTVGTLIKSKATQNRMMYLKVNASSITGWNLNGPPAATWTSNGVKYTNTSTTNNHYLAFVKVA